jgi:DNA-binding MarR family transcriptional regulator
MSSVPDSPELRADAERLADLITVLQRCFLSNLCKELASGDVTIPQYCLLCHLSQCETLTMSAIAQKMDHTTAAATGLVDRLEALGYVQRAHASEDRRKINVQITPRGISLVAHIRQDMVENLIEILNRLTRPEQKAWVQIYEKIASYCSKE